MKHPFLACLLLPFMVAALAAQETAGSGLSGDGPIVVVQTDSLTGKELSPASDSETTHGVPYPQPWKSEDATDASDPEDSTEEGYLQDFPEEDASLIPDGPIPPPRWRTLSLGACLEMVMDAPSGYALGMGLAADYALPLSFPAGPLSLGGNALFATTFSAVNTLELSAALRLPLWDILSQGPGGGLFVQAEAGASLIWFGDAFVPAFLGGLRTGLRVLLNDLFVEAYLRGGYPFAWGMGLRGGVRI